MDSHWPQQKDIVKVVLFGGITLKGEVVQDTGRVFKLSTGEIIPVTSIVYWKKIDKIQEIDMSGVEEE